MFFLHLQYQNIDTYVHISFFLLFPQKDQAPFSYRYPQKTLFQR